ncbi:C2H2 zinc finger protein [Scheffersomyces xylosifermentans]|uniref:C2H2 zinc finger protein n=1 Tax=Scheffersomyces xylosifermentans TaxID=1304137 RepID=UPI00315D6F31
MSPVQPAKKKRKRGHGNYPCNVAGCEKSFTRADHLARHKRNHDPQKRLECPFPGCEQTFTRNDVREKHYKRHLNDPDRTNKEHSMTSKTLSPTDLIEWLFQDELNNGTNANGTGHRHSTDFPSGFSPISLLENMFAVSPDFPSSNNRVTIDERIRQTLIHLIPSLDSNVDFGLLQIETCLRNYWLLYHPQYPILHRPSFSNSEANPLLLLAMIMLGSSLVSSTGHSDNLLHNPNALADQIAEPLRWLIYSHPDCRPPANVWVVQSLLLLESYEITSTSRALHERAYLHHGFKIQLLRRSPILGGDPLKDENEDGAYLPPNHVWKKWIEVESMKRATLMAFYLDTVHATVYGHMIILYAHQIKLSLPCEDELWEFDNSQDKKTDSLSLTRTPKFLAALKTLLHRQNVVTSSFGKKILLAGLLTIMFQMQQKDLQLSFLEWDSVKESWQQTISLAIDVWRVEICKGGCCDTETSLWFPQEHRKDLPPMLRIDDKRCKFGLYHIAQIYMRISHYDYIIYAGAPSRMNVRAGTSEYRVVEKRVCQWSQSLNGKISVIHAYLFLCEMMLSPDNDDITYKYDPNNDPFLHRKNIVASAVLVIFAYNFSLQGPEADIYESIEMNHNHEYYPDKEDGYSYLRRIRKELSRGPGGIFHRTNYGTSSTSFHDSIKLHGQQLDSISDKNHIVGLLKLFYKSYKTCRWEIGLEYSNLFRNCIERCLGRKKIVCEHMYLS